MESQKSIKRFGLVLMMPVFVLLAGCSRPDVVQDLSTLGKYDGEKVTVEGCLGYVCPEVLGAIFPDDCFISLQDSDYHDLLLDFGAGTSHLRDVLERYYPTYPNCVRVVAEGTVIGAGGGDVNRLIVASVSIYTTTTTADKPLCAYPTPLAQWPLPPSDILFVEIHARTEGRLIEGTPHALHLDHPSYDFSDGVLHSGQPIRQDDAVQVLVGYSTVLSLPDSHGGGVSESISVYDALPVEIQAQVMQVHSLNTVVYLESVESDGTLHALFDCEPVALRPGERWERQAQETGELAGAKMEYTARLAVENHGLLGKDRIVAPTPEPIPTRPPTPTPTPDIRWPDYVPDQVGDTHYRRQLFFNRPDGLWASGGGAAKRLTDGPVIFFQASDYNLAYYADATTIHLPNSTPPPIPDGGQVAAVDLDTTKGRLAYVLRHSEQRDWPQAGLWIWLLVSQVSSRIVVPDLDPERQFIGSVHWVPATDGGKDAALIFAVLPYELDDEPQLYRVPPEGGDPVPFGPPGYTLVNWTGKELLLAGPSGTPELTPGETTLYLANIDGEDPRRLLPEGMTGGEGFWFDAGRGWVVSASEVPGEPRYLWLGRPWQDGSGMVWQRLTTQEGREEVHLRGNFAADAVLYIARTPGAATGDLMIVPLGGSQPPARLVDGVLSFEIGTIGMVHE